MIDDDDDGDDDDVAEEDNLATTSWDIKLDRLDVRRGMSTHDKLRMRRITHIFLQKQPARFLIQCRLRVVVYEQTFDGDENMADPVLLFPIFL